MTPQPFIADTGARATEHRIPGIYTTRDAGIAWELNEAIKAGVNGDSPGLIAEHITNALVMLKTQSAQPEQRNTHDVLAEMASTLIEILAELKRGNSVAREGAVSSVEVKTSTRGVDISCKAYAGSDIESAGNAAAAEYERVRSMIEARLMNGEKP